MNNLLSILLLLLSSTCIAQFYSNYNHAIINDPDGYTNVRSEQNVKASIVHILGDGEIFEYEKSEDSKWIKVWIPINKFSLGTRSEAKKFLGYIHQSRVQSLQHLDNCPSEELQIEYEIEPFDSTGRVLERRDGKWLVQIDGRPVWGIDGGLPRTQVKRIHLSINGVKISVHEIFYRDLFECRNQFEIKKEKDFYYVYQLNSDGAGAYSVIWVLSQEGIKQRIIHLEA